MVIKVGVNGFGRVGRVIFRTCLGHPNIEIAAINDPAIEVDYICYLIKFDSTHGTLKNNITHTDNEIKVDELHIKVFQQKQPTNIPWQTAGVEYVVEASGMFTGLEKASGHLLCDGVKRVIVTAPSVDVPMVILGVNEGKIKPEYKVISCGSSTLYCLAPIVKILEDNYGVEEGFITSIHAMTPSLKPLDGLCMRGKHWRDHRSITQNIIPAVTGACKALGRIIPSVRDKLCGLAFRVPIANVSVLDFTVRLKKYTSIENIVNDVSKFGKSGRGSIITTTREESVSSDFVGDSHSCILDVGSSLQLKPNSFKLVCWYENEYSYACRVIDLILFSEAQFDNYENNICSVQARASEKQDIDQQTDCVLLDNINLLNPFEDRTAEAHTKNISVNTPKVPRPMILRKTVFQSQIPCLKSDPKKTDLIKMWEEENNAKKFKLAAQQKPLSLLQTHSEMSPPTLTTVDRFKAQERLERVKREFTKMVNITEDLLRKSHNSKLSCGSSIDPSKEELIKVSTLTNSVTSNTPSNKNFKIQNIKKAGPVLSDASEDGRTSATTMFSKHVIITSSTEEVESCMRYGNDWSDCNVTINGQNQTAQNCITPESKKEVSESDEFSKYATPNSGITNPETTLESATANKNYLSKTFTHFFDGFSKKFQLQSYSDKTIGEAKESTNESSDKFVNSDTSDDTHLNLLIKPESSKIINRNLATIQVLNVDVFKNKGPPTNLNKEVAKPEISSNLLPNRDTDTQADEKQVSSMIYDGPMVDEISQHADNGQESGDRVNGVTEEDSKEDDVHSQEDSYTSIADCVPALPGDESCCSSPTYRHKQDIYDKLDSASASGSDNSFEVDGRRSQVIKISDLTNSLDDLDRLDKICRIMEISDELSNKLFATLDEGADSMSATKKKWSFKDLCAKINLDEFCNNVFGK